MRQLELYDRVTEGFQIRKWGDQIGIVGEKVPSAVWRLTRRAERGRPTGRWPQEHSRERKGVEIGTQVKVPI